jgi:hypothetical protein
MSDRTLYLERPSFWTEIRDPECWYRGLKVLARVEQEESIIHGTPRSLWQRHLKQVLSRRSILGLFGMASDPEQNFLLGAGFLQFNPDKNGWQLAAGSKPLVTEVLQKPLEDKKILKRLGIALLKQSPWIRLLVFRLTEGDWSLSGWNHLRDGNGKLKAGVSLILHRNSEENDWFSGIEQFCTTHWFSSEQPVTTIRLHPDVKSRDSRRDDFSWAPFKAPLYLFDYLGWLTGEGVLKIPSDVLKITGIKNENKGRMDVTAIFRDITKRHADLRGFVAVEKVLREFYENIYPDQNPNADEFVVWMDGLMSCAMKKGAIEILAAEPGQARHGRGILGDRQRKLAKWVIHEDFSDCLSEVKHNVTR